MNISRNAYLLTALICISISLNSLKCFGGKQKSPYENVTLQLKWYHQFQFAGIYAAIEKGFYKKNGLNVKLIEGTPSTDIYGEVASNKAQFGIGTSYVLVKRNEGLPLVVLGSVFQHSPIVLMTLKDSGITTPEQLIGKRIMISTPADIEIILMLLSEGISLKDIKVADHSWNISDLISGKIDAQSAYSTNEPYLLKQNGYEPFIMKPVNYGIDFYGDCMFTNEQEIKDHPERVKAFWDATRLGWEYAMEHPKEIVDIILQKYSRGKTRDALLYETKAMIPLIQPELVEIGHTNPGRWKRSADLYVKAGVLKPDYSLDGLF